MDCAKLIAFGTYHTDDLWEYVKSGKKSLRTEKTAADFDAHPSVSGSEYGMGAVSADSRTGDFGTAFWHYG